MSELGDRMKMAREAKNLSQPELAMLVGYAQTTLSEIEIGNVTSPRKWKQIADALDIPHDEMLALMRRSSRESGKQKVSRAAGRDKPRPTASIMNSSPKFSMRRVPVYGQAVGGAVGEYIFNGNVIDYVECPYELENVSDAYAVYVDGDSMSPRYDPRDTLWAHPGKPPRPGDDVVVQIANKRIGEPPHGYIKQFVGWSGSKLKLRQFNPDKEVVFDRNAVVSVHPVVYIKRG